MKHESVLLEEVIESLKLKKNSIVVDATLGLGGHSKAILNEIPQGFLYCFEQDSQIIEEAKNKLKKFSNYEIINQNFVLIVDELKNRNIQTVDAILFDLGVSSPQLDNAERGFSYQQDGPLDMRMNPQNEKTAACIINNYSESELVNILFKYGEEKYARSIVKNIIKKREKQQIKTTGELKTIIQESVPMKYRREKHPARKTFQAIRIAVNDELLVLEKALKKSLELLNKEGRLAVITFHSLEDRICQKIFKQVSQIDSNLKKLPFIPESKKPKFKIIGKIRPSKVEILNNNRSRSATLRIVERI